MLSRKLLSCLWLVAFSTASKFRSINVAQQAPSSKVDLGEEGRAVVMAMLLCSAGFLSVTLFILVACCLLDTALSWKHRATYYACRQKVQQVQEALMKGKEDLSLCPCCVETTQYTQPQKKVKFICGHGYHLHCVNRWFQEHPNSVGSCPVCEGETAGGDTPRDEAQTFILHSLHRRFPTIITKECMDSWEGCNAELWLTVLKCPRYSSLFSKVFARE
mmetsp:Transcript_112011/g.157019  ORF Transcript_112011/g.157019 Transcript_112011/m.157019 type:complete len:218 (-) Transcript_112011:55-708(-)